VLEVAMRSADLEPHERMGGLVYFEPAWDAKLLTLRLDAHRPGGPPLDLVTRFEVSR
jgi:hypothetical protein